jgi:hypothetical protein
MSVAGFTNSVVYKLMQATVEAGKIAWCIENTITEHMDEDFIRLFDNDHLDHLQDDGSEEWNPKDAVKWMERLTASARRSLEYALSDYGQDKDDVLDEQVTFALAALYRASLAVRNERHRRQRIERSRLAGGGSRAFGPGCPYQTAGSGFLAVAAPPLRRNRGTPT